MHMDYVRRSGGQFTGKIYDRDGNEIFGSASAPVTSPAGSNTQVQYNNSGAFGASANLTFNGTKLDVGGDVEAKSFIPDGTFAAQSSVEAGNRVGAIEWKDNVHFVTDYLVRRTIVRGQDVRKTTTTVANTTTETEILHVAHGEDYLIAGKMEEVHLWGLINSVTGTGDNTLTFNIKYAGTSLGTIVMPEASRSSENIEMHIVTTVRTAGKSGTLQVHANVDTQSDGTLGYVNTSASIDTTASEALTVTAQWSNASTSNSVQILQGRVVSIDDNQWT